MGILRAARAAVSRRALVVVPIVAVLVAASYGVASGSATGRPHALKYRGGHSSTNGGNLIDHGGQITSTSHTYAIFWGNAGAWSSDVQPGIASLFTGFNGSSYLGIASQYMRGAAISSAYNGSTADPSSPPRKVSPATLGAEVARLYGTSLDAHGIYFVYTSNFPSGGGFCAWHSFATVNGQNVAVAYMPNTNAVAGCNPGNLYGVSGSEGLRSLANVTAHEFMEAVTDTWPANGTLAWTDQSGSEIGDKCAWQFTGPVTLSNNTTWQLQEEWDNSITGCSQG